MVIPRDLPYSEPSSVNGQPESFLVTYEICAHTEDLARHKAETVALEQSIEAPASLVQGTAVEREVLATVISVTLRYATLSRDHLAACQPYVH